MAAVALVVLNKGAASTEDTPIRDRLVALGHTVTYFSDEDAEADPSLYDLVVIGRINAPTLGTKYRDYVKPVLAMDADAWTPTYLALCANQFNETTQTDVYVEDATHTLAGGLAVGTHTVATAGDLRYYTRTVDIPNATAFPVRRLSASHPVIFGYESGVEMASSVKAINRKVGFGIGRMSDVKNTNWDALFDGAISWLLAGKPIPNANFTVTISRRDVTVTDASTARSGTTLAAHTVGWGDASADSSCPVAGSVAHTYTGGSYTISFTANTVEGVSNTVTQPIITKGRYPYVVMAENASGTTDSNTVLVDVPDA